jgi:putative transposase
VSPLLLNVAEELVPRVGAAATCRALGLNRASFYRYRPRRSALLSPTPSGGIASNGVPDDLSNGGVVKDHSETKRNVTLPPAAPTPAAPTPAAPTPAAPTPAAPTPAAPTPAVTPSSVSSVSSVSAVPEDAASALNDAKAAFPLAAFPVAFPAFQPVCSAQPSLCSLPARLLAAPERQQVLEILRSSRFVDLSPTEVYATLLDEGRFLCSIRTMYRILCENQEVRERRNQLRHPTYTKPELLATAPNQLWSWDITKLRARSKATYFHLYVLLDVFSRYVVGWTVAAHDTAEIAQELIRETCLKQDILPEQLTLHADRGSAMTSKPVALLLSDLGVNKTHSRPHVSNDNPYSEAQFKTLKYRPDFPDRFEDMIHARHFCRDFFDWYNKEHHHSGIALLTPEVVHYGQADKVLAARQRVLTEAYAKHPERFVRHEPRVQVLPKTVWINPPAADGADLTNDPPVTFRPPLTPATQDPAGNTGTQP